MNSKQAWSDRAGLDLEGNSPWYRWQCYFSAEELAALLHPWLQLPPGGTLRQVEVGERDELGRVVNLTVQTTAGTASI